LRLRPFDDRTLFSVRLATALWVALGAMPLPGQAWASNRLHEQLQLRQKEGGSRVIRLLKKEKTLKTGFIYHKKKGKGLKAPLPADGVQSAVDPSALKLLLAVPENSKDWVEIPIDLPDGRSITLQLYRVTPSVALRVVTHDGKPLPYEPSSDFRGVALGDSDSKVSLSVSPSGKVMGFVSFEGEVFDFGNVRPSNKAPRPHVGFSSKDEEPSAPGSIVLQETGSLDSEGKPCAGAMDPSFASAPAPSGSASGATATAPTAEALVSGVRPARVTLVTDYDLYLKYNSNSTNLKAFISGLFAQVATLYAAEGIPIELAEIQTFTAPDPWATLTASQGSLGFLNAFSTYMYNNGNPRFTGDLAHLLTARSLNLGGIAATGVLCRPDWSYGFDNIYNFYSSAPTYSWSVYVLTHELGHNFGSKHTHACAWTVNGVSMQALDGCYTPEGTCAQPAMTTAKGTLMSYCHLTANGIDFNKGFGPQPGDLIRTMYANSYCLRQGTPTPTPIPTPTPSPTPKTTPTPSPTPNSTPTPSPKPSATPTASPSASPSSSPVPRPTASPTGTPNSSAVSFEFDSSLTQGAIASWTSVPLTLSVTQPSQVSKIEYFVNSTAVCSTIPATGVCSISLLTRTKTYSIKVRITTTGGTTVEKTLSLRGQ